jgi:hypothetical protein
MSERALLLPNAYQTNRYPVDLPLCPEVQAAWVARAGDAGRLGMLNFVWAGGAVVYLAAFGWLAGRA